MSRGKQNQEKRPQATATRPLTMKDIAELAGVSTATVSLALKNSPRLPPATRVRIQKLAETQGYRPNPYLSILMQSRQRGRLPSTLPVIAMVYGLDKPTGWKSAATPTIGLFKQGAAERAAALGYKTEEFWLYKDGMSNRRFSDMLYARGIQGILFGPLMPKAPTPSLAWDRFTVVSVGGFIPGLDLPIVCHDHYLGCLTAVEHCLQLGYERPGIVLLLNHHVRFGGRWEAGFRMGQRALPVSGRIDPLHLGEEFTEAAFAAWFRKHRPDVIITPIFQTVGDALLRMGLKVPRDIGLVALNCPEPDHACSGIYQNGLIIGARAVDLLLGMMAVNDRGLQDNAALQMVPGAWNPGTTLRRQA